MRGMLIFRNGKMLRKIIKKELVVDGRSETSIFTRRLLNGNAKDNITNLFLHLKIHLQKVKQDSFVPFGEKKRTAGFESNTSSVDGWVVTLVEKRCFFAVAHRGWRTIPSERVTLFVHAPSKQLTQEQSQLFSEHFARHHVDEKVESIVGLADLFDHQPHVLVHPETLPFFVVLHIVGRGWAVVPAEHRHEDVADGDWENRDNQVGGNCKKSEGGG